MGNIRNILTTLWIIFISLIIAIVFGRLGFKESNIILVFTVGVMFVSRFTEGYTYGILGSVMGVICFNFFFTQPYFTLHVNDQDYFITFMTMLIASILTSTATSKTKKEAEMSQIKEQKLRVLYENNKRLLKSKSKEEIIKCCAESLGQMLNRSVYIQIKSTLTETIEYEYINQDYYDKKTKNILDQNQIKMYFEENKPNKYIEYIDGETNLYYYPILGKKNILGVVCILDYTTTPILDSERITIKSMFAQVALAIEKEELYEANKNNILKANIERTRGNLLRSISHDLRTPLASILGSTSTILENYDKIEDKQKKELLQNICEDSNWLTRSVENILSLTKLDEGRFEIKKSIEIAEEIVFEAVKVAKHFQQNKSIKVKIPDEIIIVKVDPLLIKQVLVNLIDNAIRYTKKDSNILIEVEAINENVVFRVSDDGNGIPTEDLKYIFDRFYTKTEGKNLETRGIGLGLSICKSIVNAHNGEIIAYNNNKGGATFEFYIPNTKGD
ncbi:MAG: sensor histidine kinase [Peptostreptococcaceae bacterium]